MQAFDKILHVDAVKNHKKCKKVLTRKKLSVKIIFADAMRNEHRQSMENPLFSKGKNGFGP